jgi:hypothetical protein
MRQIIVYLVFCLVVVAGPASCDKIVSQQSDNIEGRLTRNEIYKAKQIIVTDSLTLLLFETSEEVHELHWYNVSNDLIATTQSSGLGVQKIEGNNLLFWETPSYYLHNKNLVTVQKLPTPFIPMFGSKVSKVRAMQNKRILAVEADLTMKPINITITYTQDTTVQFSRDHRIEAAKLDSIKLDINFLHHYNDGIYTVCIYDGVTVLDRYMFSDTLQLDQIRKLYIDAIL